MLRSTAPTDVREGKETLPTDGQLKMVRAPVMEARRGRLSPKRIASFSNVRSPSIVTQFSMICKAGLKKDP